MVEEEALPVTKVKGWEILGGKGGIIGCRDLLFGQKRHFIPFDSMNSNTSNVNSSPLNILAGFSPS